MSANGALEWRRSTSPMAASTKCPLHPPSPQPPTRASPRQGRLGHRQTRSFNSVNWRKKGQKAPSQALPKWRVGDIAYLRSADPTVSSVWEAEVSLAWATQSAREHPAMITSVTEDTATVCIVTSFGGKTLQEQYCSREARDKYRRHTEEYLPIHSSVTPLQGVPQLQLEAVDSNGQGSKHENGSNNANKNGKGGRGLVKNSYLKISEQWQVHLKDLVPFRGPDNDATRCRLTPSSLCLAKRALNKKSVLALVAQLKGTSSLKRRLESQAAPGCANTIQRKILRHMEGASMDGPRMIFS